MRQQEGSKNQKVTATQPDWEIGYPSSQEERQGDSDTLQRLQGESRSQGLIERQRQASRSSISSGSLDKVRIVAKTQEMNMTLQDKSQSQIQKTEQVKSQIQQKGHQHRQFHHMTIYSITMTGKEADGREVKIKTKRWKIGALGIMAAVGIVLVIGGILMVELKIEQEQLIESELSTGVMTRMQGKSPTNKWTELA